MRGVLVLGAGGVIAASSDGLSAVNGPAAWRLDGPRSGVGAPNSREKRRRR